MLLYTKVYSVKYISSKWILSITLEQILTLPSSPILHYFTLYLIILTRRFEPVARKFEIIRIGYIGRRK